ncbi:unnamed protein product [Polarella glacialis]|uniref:Uncharacterized protein n=1 Tax=Polarella glacialis TaxID=89957 RepID=A0A813I8F7_POLGL|nr:unnamed protein product [Polarella glacialis]
MRSPTERGSLSPCPLFLWHSSFHDYCFGALLWRLVVIQTLSFMTQGVRMRRTFLQGQQLQLYVGDIETVCRVPMVGIMCEAPAMVPAVRLFAEPRCHTWGQSQQHRHAVSVR